MIVLTLEKILEFLKTRGHQAHLQKETKQVALILNVDGVEFPAFLRILSDGPLLQLIVFLPCNLSEKTVPELSRLLHLLNKEMDIPGFGIDEDAGVVFYRVVLPALSRKVDPTLFETYINSLKIICKSFTPVIQSVAQGTMTFDAIRKKARETQHHSNT